MNHTSTRRPGRVIRALAIAGIALGVATGGTALAQAENGAANPGGWTAVQTSKDCAYKQPTLSYGSTGECVRFLQELLGIKADGIFGPDTDKAVRGYQSAKGLKVDGIVGPQTWSALLWVPVSSGA